MKNNTNVWMFIETLLVALFASVIESVVAVAYGGQPFTKETLGTAILFGLLSTAFSIYNRLKGVQVGELIGFEKGIEEAEPVKPFAPNPDPKATPFYEE